MKLKIKKKWWSKNLFPNSKLLKIKFLLFKLKFKIKESKKLPSSQNTVVKNRKNQNFISKILSCMDPKTLKFWKAKVINSKIKSIFLSMKKLHIGDHQKAHKKKSD